MGRGLRVKAMFWLLAGLWVAGPAAAAEPGYSFGVVPQQSPSLLAEGWAPVLAMLSDKAGVRISFATAPDVPTFERRLAAGTYDFAYMNPYHFVLFNAQPGYRALARAKGERIRALVVVRKDSPLRGLADLAGSTLAFPAPAAFAATLLVQAELRRQGIGFKAAIVKSHSSVYRAVAKELYPAGGGVPRTLELLDDNVAAELRVLWSSPDYTSHAIASRPGIDDAVRARIWRAMAEMTADPAARERLKRIEFEGFEPAQDQDWDDIRALGMPLVEMGSQD